MEQYMVETIPTCNMDEVHKRKVEIKKLDIKSAHTRGAHHIQFTVRLRPTRAEVATGSGQTGSPGGGRGLLPNQRASYLGVPWFVCFLHKKL